MKSKKVLSLLITCAMTASMGTTVFASTEDQIAAAQAQRQEAQAGLDQAQANISGLESKKQELESYLSELNSQYNELTESISQLSTQAAEKEDELTKVKVALASAQKAAIKQKEAMSDRIQYIYEHGGTTMFEALISAGSLSELLNQANSISELSKYDRNMLEKYEATQKNIAEQQQKIEEESASINTMLTEKGSKQQEVQNLVATTSDNISSYVNQISASQEEADILMAQVSNADNDIAVLMEQAEQERAAAEAEAEAVEAEAYNEEDSYDEEDSYSEEEDASYDDESSAENESESSDGSYTEDTESSGDGSYSEDEDMGTIDDDSDYKDMSEDTDSSSSDSGEDSSSDSSSSDGGSSDSSQGTYLGNFKLTAYCNCASCCGTAGNATASGVMPVAGRTVAMAGVPFGTKLLINGNVYTVEDLGTPYGHVDIYCGSHSEALSFGLQYADVYQLN
ncbi:MAG: hypothetical protein Q4Q33_11180 [Eubacteriales bacterium]|nr:hypothetical protein [Eubacteriales bacterium]